jgi:phospholipase/carboxylesterase
MTEINALSGPSLPPASGEPATSVVVLMHGYGASGNDLIGLAPFFAQVMPQTVFYAPNAPEPWEGGAGGTFQWFGLSDYDPDLMRRDPLRMGATFNGMVMGAEKAAPALNQYLDQILEHLKLTTSRMVLLGFSQGTMMALHVGLRRPEQLAGILGFSGALIAADRLAGEIKSRPPVTLVHGEDDPVVPVQAMAEVEKALSVVEVSVETYAIPGLQHSIDGNGAQIGAAFLKAHLG